MNEESLVGTMLTNTLVDIPGFKVGHATNLEAATGCTVVICPPGTIGGVDVRGGGPGTRETDLLASHNHVEQVHAVVLSGGSAFGLAAADGVMGYLEKHDIGYKSIPGFTIPIVPAAILFDLGIGNPAVRPDAAMGYAACEQATDTPVIQGTVGAGTGCTVGKYRGLEWATKSGLGSASIDLGDGLYVAAIVAVNAVGNVVDERGNIIAGVRDDTGQFVDALSVLRLAAHMERIGPPQRESTVIGAVATNARLSKSHVNKIAQMAHDGIARAVHPSHTMQDGDTIFALATGEKPSNATVIGAFAAEVMAQAIRNGVRHATSLDGFRAWDE